MANIVRWFKDSSGVWHVLNKIIKNIGAAAASARLNPTYICKCGKKIATQSNTYEEPVAGEPVCEQCE